GRPSVARRQPPHRPARGRQRWPRARRDRRRRHGRQRSCARLSRGRPDRLCRRLPPPRHRLARARSGDGMNALWSFFWPPFAVGLLIGVIGGAIAFRRRRLRDRALLAAFALSVAVAGLWTGPFGAADRFVASVEHEPRLTLAQY